MVVDETVVPDNNEKKVTTAEDYFGYAPELFEENKTGSDRHTETEPVSVQDRINSVLKEVKVGEDGKFIYPDDISPELKAAVAATKSFRDTQSSYTKTQQENKVTKAELEALKAQLSKYETPDSGLTPREKAALNELKFTDPDRWYIEMERLKKESATRIDEKFEGVKEEARTKTIQEIRLDTLEAYNKTAEKPLTTEMLDFDVPGRWKQEVEAGTLSFEDFLTRAGDFIHSNKVVANETVDNPTNLNDISGGTKEVIPQKGVIDYANTTF